MVAREWVEIIVAASIPIAIIGMVVNRIWSGKGLGVRAIQFLALSLFPPTVLILALEHVMDGAAISALFGAVLGYLFSNIGEYDKSRQGGNEADR